MKFLDLTSDQALEAWGADANDFSILTYNVTTCVDLSKPKFIVNRMFFFGGARLLLFLKFYVFGLFF